MTSDRAAYQECNDDAWQSEYQWSREELQAHDHPRCWLCGGSGYIPDIFGDAEPCPECADYEDAIAEAIIDNTGYPF
jgi:hypothetical protein